MSPSSPHILIAGGGVAALEALIALRDLGGDEPRVTLLAPEPDFVYRPMSVAEPFCLGHAQRHPLASIARDFGAALVRDSLAEVDAGARTVTTGSGDTIAYDSLLIAVGARQEAVFSNAITFGAEGARELLSGLLSDLELGYVKRIAFVVPSPVAWSLPLYELAIMTARDAWSAGIDGLEIVFVTPEDRPLTAFGAEASTAVGELLDEEGVQFIGSTHAEVGHGFVIAGDRRIRDPRRARGRERLHPRRRARCRRGPRGRVRGRRRRELPDQAGRPRRPAGGGRGDVDSRPARRRSRPAAVPPGAARDADDRR
jgi:hypothetical protein